MIDKAYSNFVEESELFFVKPFMDSKSVKERYSECLDIIYDISGKMDCGRGLIAYNPRYGQGKSFFFEVVQHRHRRISGKNKFFWTTARELCEVYLSSGKNEDPTNKLGRFIEVKNLFIDDIGDELKDGKERSHYGNKMNVVRWVLLRRYELWQKKGWRTYGTTNLSVKEIGENYDGRVADRIKQMVYFLDFDFLKGNASFRQMKATRRLTDLEVSENFKKLYNPVKKDLKIDRVKFLNELIKEDIGYLEGKDLCFWEMVMNFLIEIEVVKESDFKKIDENILNSSERKIKKEVISYESKRSKYAPAAQQKKQMDKAMNKITKRKVFDNAKILIAKNKFIELKKQNYIF